jgi:hypothetical protein
MLIRQHHVVHYRQYSSLQSPCAFHLQPTTCLSQRSLQTQLFVVANLIGLHVGLRPLQNTARVRMAYFPDDCLPKLASYLAQFQLAAHKTRHSRHSRFLFWKKHLSAHQAVEPDWPSTARRRGQHGGELRRGHWRSPDVRNFAGRYL